MRRIFTFGGQAVERNLTVADIRAAKGQRKLVQVNPGNVEEAAAVTEAGMDMMICGMPQAESVRQGAPNLFLTVGVPFTEYISKDEVLRGAMKVMEMGADAVYCGRSLEIVDHLAKEDIPVMGHLGLVPRKCGWIGGLRAFGKTAEEAIDLYQQVKRLEDAGAFAVELEVVADEALAAISPKTSLITISLGSGGGGDVEYLFVEDICGDNPNPPRHGKAYGDIASLKEKVAQERIRSLKAFKDDVDAGGFPTSAQTVKMSEDEKEKMLKAFSS